MERKAAPMFRLTRMQRSEAMARLERDLLTQTTDVEKLQLATVAALAERECWRLEYGGPPGATVSALMEDDTSVSVTSALPVMHALTSAPLGTPVLQLAAESQSPEAPPPTQVSLQLNVSPGGALPRTVDDASNRVVVPATTRSPAATAPARRATGRWERRAVPCPLASRRFTLPSLGPTFDRRPFARAQLGVPRSIVSAAPRWW